MVKVFKTSVNNVYDAMAVVKALRIKMELAEINIDIEDVDNILRIENKTIDVSEVEETVSVQGHTASLLE